MGKRQVRVIRVPKWVTLLLLAAVSVAMLAAIRVLAGRAYAPVAQTSAAGVLADIATRRGPRPSADSLLALLMPAAANAMIFIPWGFLAFVALDRPSRPRRLSYVLTVGAGTAFALAITLWQETLPARVTAHADVVANAVGALAGAAAGHLRKQVRVQFEV